MSIANDTSLSRALAITALALVPLTGCDPDAIIDIVDPHEPPVTGMPASGVPADTWAERGRLLGYQHMRTLSQAEIQQAQFDVPFADSYASFGIEDLTDFYTAAEIDAVVRHDVDVYRVFYETVDAWGSPTVASGAVLLPQVDVLPEEGLGLWGLLRGTIYYDDDAPSHGEMPDFGIWRGLLPAAAGYVTAMPDYLGFGASRSHVHTYLVAEPTATAAVDMLRATRHLSEALGLPLRDDVFLSGHSQGGHGTLATLRTLESQHADEFEVTAAAPASAPYAISGVIAALFDSDTLIAPQVTSLYTVVLASVYGLDQPLSHYFVPPYDEVVLELHDKEKTNAELIDGLPSGNTNTLYTQEFLDAFRGDGELAFKEALALNNVHTGWNPNAPVRLFHGEADTIVPLIQSQAALAGLTGEGTDITLEVIPGAGHLQTIVPATLQTIHWFDTLD